jgi:hypothetical protein
MGSLFTKRPRQIPLNLVTLPAFCVPAGESESLIAKRAAKLQWMQEKGLKYLGDPIKKVEKRTAPPQGPARVVGLRILSDAPAIRAVARDA